MGTILKIVMKIELNPSTFNPKQSLIKNKKSTELSHQLWYKLENYSAFLIKAATNPNTCYVLGVKTNELNNIERVVLLPEELIELFYQLPNYEHNLAKIFAKSHINCEQKFM